MMDVVCLLSDMRYSEQMIWSNRLWKCMAAADDAYEQRRQHADTARLTRGAG